MYVFLDISGVENSYHVCPMFCRHPFVWSIFASRWLQYDDTQQFEMGGRF